MEHARLWGMCELHSVMLGRLLVGCDAVWLLMHLVVTSVIDGATTGLWVTPSHA